MRRIFSTMGLVAATVALSATVALAGVTFHSGPPSSGIAMAQPTATGNLSGLGNTGATAYLQITTSYSYTCENRGGNVAPGQNSVTVVGAAGSHELNSTTKNGRSDLSVTAFPGTPAEQISGSAAGCPNGNWKGVNPTATGPATATLWIVQGGKIIYGPTTF